MKNTFTVYFSLSIEPLVRRDRKHSEFINPVRGLHTRKRKGVGLGKDQKRGLIRSRHAVAVFAK